MVEKYNPLIEEMERQWKKIQEKGGLDFIPGMEKTPEIGIGQQGQPEVLYDQLHIPDMDPSNVRDSRLYEI